jgi:SAM-dependent methyltransferase
MVYKKSILCETIENVLNSEQHSHAKEMKDINVVCNVEREVKFSNISYYNFKNIASYLRSRKYNIITVQNLDVNRGDVRMTVPFDDITKYCNSDIITNFPKMEKKRISNVINSDYDIRIGIAIETKLSDNHRMAPSGETTYRYKKRTSFISDEYRCDLTIVKQVITSDKLTLKMFDKVQPIFEVEVELIDAVNNNIVPHLNDIICEVIDSIWKILHNNTHVIYDKKTETLIKSEFCSTFGKVYVESQNESEYFPCPNVNQLTVNKNIFSNTLNDYYVAYKADGLHGCLFMYDIYTTVIYLIDNKICINLLSVGDKYTNKYVFESESVIIDLVDRRYYIFDILYNATVSYIDNDTMTYDKRYEEILKFKIPAISGIEVKGIKVEKTKINNVHIKDILNHVKPISEVLISIDTHAEVDSNKMKIDGLIFTNKKSVIFKVTNTNKTYKDVLKYKEIHTLSIDALIRYDIYKCLPSTNVSVEFFTTDKNQLIKMITTELKCNASGLLITTNGDHITNGAIIECILDISRSDIKRGIIKWMPIRVRYDKKYPNNKYTVDSIINNIKFFKSIKSLIDISGVSSTPANTNELALEVINSDIYYEKSEETDKNKELIASYTLFHNVIKESIILYSTGLINIENNNNNIGNNNNNNKSKIVVDLSCGVGGDFGKFQRAGYTSLLGIDKDISKTRKPKMDNFIMQADLCEKLPKNKGYEKFIGNADLVSCQFAIHYMFKDEKSVNNLIDTVKTFLKPGGYFICTTISGDIISNVFDIDDTDEITATFNDKLMLSYKKKYQSYSANSYGLEIETYLPHINLSRDNEYIVKDSLIIDAFQTKGFELHKQLYFKSMYNESFNMPSQLQLFSFLNKAYIFKYIGTDK